MSILYLDVDITINLVAVTVRTDRIATLLRTIYLLL